MLEGALGTVVLYGRTVLVEKLRAHLLADLLVAQGRELRGAGAHDVVRRRHVLRGLPISTTTVSSSSIPSCQSIHRKRRMEKKREGGN